MQAPDTRSLQDLAKPRASLKDLADEAGVSLSLIYKVASGRRKPNAAIRRAVELVYGVPASQVFGDEEARPRDSSE